MVTSGASTVDESRLTGEPMPVRKAPGAPVVGGTVAVALPDIEVPVGTVTARPSKPCCACATGSALSTSSMRRRGSDASAKNTASRVSASTTA